MYKWNILSPYNWKFHVFRGIELEPDITILPITYLHNTQTIEEIGFKKPMQQTTN